jgi:predicted small lipoprotein YifL
MNQFNRFTRVAKWSTALVIVASLAACGSSGDDDKPTPPPPPPLSDIPASAQATVAGLLAFARGLVATETAEPLNLGNATVQVSDDTEPDLTF